MIEINKNLFQIIHKIILINVFSIIMTGCASIVAGQNQPVSVKTLPVKGATCELVNNKGRWFIPTTPGSVVVHRSYNDLKVVCHKKGYKLAEKMIASSTKPLVFGNIIFGGVIGAGVDIFTGSAYDYPTNINVDMLA